MTTKRAINHYTNKQKIALEKVTGKPYFHWYPEAVQAYFAFTDKGITLDVPEVAKADLQELLHSHKFHPVTVEMWKEDFKKGLLFLSDFRGYPDNYQNHAREIYNSVMA